MGSDLLLRPVLVVVEDEDRALLVGQQGQRLGDLGALLGRERVGSGDAVEKIGGAALVILDRAGLHLRLRRRAVLLDEVNEAAFQAKPEAYLPEFAAALLAEQVLEHLHLHIPDALLHLLGRELPPAPDMLVDEAGAPLDQQFGDLPGCLALATPVPVAQDADQGLVLYPLRRRTILEARTPPEFLGRAGQQELDLRFDLRFPIPSLGLERPQRAKRSIWRCGRTTFLHPHLRRESGLTDT